MSKQTDNSSRSEAVESQAVKMWGILRDFIDSSLRQQIESLRDAEKRWSADQSQYRIKVETLKDVQRVMNLLSHQIK